MGEACGAWVDHPERMGRPDLLVGVGAAPQTAADPLGQARKSALADMAEQIRVRVLSSDVSEQRSVSSGKKDAESQYLDSWVNTRSDVNIEGASQLDACQERGAVYVLMGVSRRRLVAGGLERLRRLAKLLERDRAKALGLAKAGRHFEAAAIYRGDIHSAKAAQRLADFVRIVGQESPEVTFLGPGEDERAARAAFAKALVGVEAQPIAAAGPLAQAALVCLGQAGLTAAGPSEGSDAVLDLTLTPGTPQQLYAGLYMATARVGASLRRRSDGATLAATEESARGAGTTAEAATRDAVRKLAEEKLPNAIDRMLQASGWPVKPCAAVAASAH